MPYEERIIDQVQSANEIVEILSQYVPLKKSGRNFKGLCPFHQEKTPSFMVHPEKQIFHCFGCGAGGDVFSFLMRYENLSFPEALRQLAEKAHIALPEASEGKGAKSGETEQFYEIYRFAAEYYHQQFLDPQKGKQAREYFLKRGFDMALAGEFRIGWASERWQDLFIFLSKKGFSEALLLKSGLVFQSAKRTLCDLFRARLLFPIHNLQGKVVAFGGRVIDDQGSPKYLNSPENPIFYKRRELFGLNWAKKFIDREHPRLLIVEGYFGFLRLYQAGFRACVATLGTSLTDSHVQLLHRFAEEAIMVYDGDKAGESASLRGLEVFLEEAVSVKIARLPQGLDPDDFIQEKGKEAFQKILADARDFMDYKLEILLGRFNRSDSFGLMKITQEFLETLVKIKNPVLLGHSLRRLSASLGVEENSLRSELEKLKRKVEGAAAGRLSQKKDPQPSSSLMPSDEMILLALAVEQNKWRAILLEELEAADFTDPQLRAFFQMLRNLEEERLPIHRYQILNRLEDEQFKEKWAAVTALDWAGEQQEKAFEDCLRKLKKKRIERRLENLRREIAQAEREGDLTRVDIYIKEYQDIWKESK